MPKLKLGIDLKDFKRGVAATGVELNKLKSKTRKTTKSMKKDFKSLKASAMGFKTVLIGLTTGFTLGVIIKEINSVGMEFEKTMVIVKGVSRATQDEFEAMSDSAKLLGETTEFSATQAAEGLKFLTMAGISVTDSVTALPGVLDLATAGNLDLATSADIASNAMTAMGMSANELNRINDSFINTTTISNSTVQMLAESFKYVAPTANALGYDIEQLNAFLGKLHDAGIQGSMAGTQLNQAMLRASRVMAKMGMEGDLIDLLERIQDEQWGVNKIMQEFSGRGGRAILILKEMVPELKALESEQRKNKDANKELADQMRDTTEGSLKAFKSIIEGIKLDTFEKNMGGSRGVLDDFTKILRDNKDIYSDSLEGIMQLGNAISVVLVGAFKLITPVIGSVNLLFQDFFKGLDMISEKAEGLDMDLYDMRKTNPEQAQFTQNIRDAQEEIKILKGTIDNMAEGMKKPGAEIAAFLASGVGGYEKQLKKIEEQKEKLKALEEKELQNQTGLNNLLEERKQKEQDIQNMAEVTFGINKDYGDTYEGINEALSTNSKLATDAYKREELKKKLATDINDEMDELSKKYTKEQQDLMAVNKQYDKLKIALEKIGDEEVDISAERKKSLDLVKKTYAELKKQKDAAEQLKVEIKEISEMPIIGDTYDDMSAGEDVAKKEQEKIDKMRRNTAEALAEGVMEGLQAGFEGGIDGALDYMKKSFFKVIGDVLQGTIADSIGNAFAESDFAAKMSDEMGSAMGGLVGGLAGAAVGVGVGLVTSSFAQKKEEEKRSKAYIDSMHKLTNAMEKNNVMLERKLSADYESHSWSEKMFEAQQDLINKYEEIGKAPKARKESEIGIVDERFERELDSWKEARQTARATYKLTMAGLKVDIIKAADEMWEGLAESYKTSYKSAHDEMTSVWGDVINGYLDATAGWSVDLINATAAEKKRIEEMESPIAKLGAILEGDYYDLESNLEATTEARKIYTQAAIAQMAMEIKFAETRNKITDDLGYYMEDLRGNTTPLSDALRTLNKQFDVWEEDLYDAGAAENSLSAERKEAIDVTTALYDANGQLLEAEEKRLDSYKQFISLSQSIQDFNESQFAATATTQDWQNEIYRITQAIGSLDANSETYNDDLYTLMNDQFEATKQLVDLARSQLNAYLDAQKSLDEQIWELTGGGTGSQFTSTSMWEERYFKLLGEAQTGDLDAISAFQSFIPQWMEVLSAAGFSSQDLAMTAAGALGGLSAGLNAPIQDVRNLAGTEITSTQEPTFITVQVVIDGREIGYTIAEQIDSGNPVLLESLDKNQQQNA
ncbi:MAG: phage tail tape measure protein [bacterium]|nr:phage tail tape measure protein [bacterium]